MKRIFLLLLFIYLSPFVFGYQWPIPESQINTTFGQRSDISGYSGFMEISARQSSVSPVMSGELIYYFDDSKTDNPGNGSTLIVLSHPGEMITVYSHLEKGRLNIQDNYTTEDILGYTLFSNAYGSRVLRLEFLDSRLKESINPLFLLPKKIDTIQPEITGTFLQATNGSTTFPLNDVREVPSGNYRLSFDAFDYALNQQEQSPSQPLAPFSIKVFLNGESIFDQQFEALYFDQGNYYFEWNNLYSDIFKDEFNISIKNLNLYPGNILLEILVADINENQQTKTYRLRVL